MNRSCWERRQGEGGVLMERDKEGVKRFKV